MKCRDLRYLSLAGVKKKTIASLRGEPTVILARRKYRISNTDRLTLILCSFADRDVWCYLAYWEERNRVGEQFLVSEPSVDVFSSTSYLPKSSGFCLETIFDKNPEPSEKVTRIRAKIGQGGGAMQRRINFNLSRMHSGVWVLLKPGHLPPG